MDNHLATATKILLDQKAEVDESAHMLTNEETVFDAAINRWQKDRTEEATYAAIVAFADLQLTPSNAVGESRKRLFNTIFDQ